MNKKLPKGWREVRLGEVCEVNPESLKENTNLNLDFYYIDLSSTCDGNYILPNTKITFKKAPSRARRIIKNNDVCFGTVRPNLKNHCKIDRNDCIASTGFAVLRAKQHCYFDYLYYYIFSYNIDKQIEQIVVGSNYPAVNSSDVSNLQISLPPLETQKEIASFLSKINGIAFRKRQYKYYLNKLLDYKNYE